MRSAPTHSGRGDLATPENDGERPMSGATPCNPEAFDTVTTDRGCRSNMTLCQRISRLVAAARLPRIVQTARPEGTSRGTNGDQARDEWPSPPRR